MNNKFLTKLIIDEQPLYIKLLPFIYVIVAVVYFSYIYKVLNWNSFWTPLIILAEAYGIFTTILFLITNRKSSYPTWQEPLQNVTVDIFIPTLNESEEILCMTISGAVGVKGVNKVYLLDDGGRDEIRKLAIDMGAEYLARPGSEHAKAGNMNHGLIYSKADFIICIDADHVPNENFIERTLGYFADEKMALVQTPQTFYNLNSFQHRKTGFNKLWNEQTMFYEGIQPAKNTYNAAFFCGSSAILRRKALDSVGGFATGTATEDIHTSLRIHAKKWKSLFINEKLAYGLAPEDFYEYYRQRVRWGAGSLGLLFRSWDSPFIAKGLTFTQRLCYLSSTLAYTQGIIKLFYLVLPILLIFSLNQATSTSLFSFLLVYIPFYLFSLITVYVFSFGTFHLLFIEQYNILNILSNFASLKGIMKVQKKFGVSIKTKVTKEGKSLETIFIILFGLMISANTFGGVYWFIFLNRNITEYVQSYLFIQMFWNTINIAVLAVILDFLSDYNKKPIIKHRFNINQNIFIPELADEFRIQNISLNGAICLTNKQVAPTEFQLHLPFISQDFYIKSKITGGSKLEEGYHKLYVKFLQLDINQKKLLTKYIFHNFVFSSIKNNAKVPFNPQNAVVESFIRKKPKPWVAS